MREVFEAIIAALESGETVVRVAVMDSTGSTPRSAGACMAVFEDGTIAGTIGGGSVEHASQKAAQGMTPETAAVRSFDLSNRDAASLGMVCGGAMTVLLDAMRPSGKTVAFAKAVLERLETGKAGYIETSLADNAAVQRKLVDQPAHADAGALFREPLPLPRTVHFIGAGHVAQATARVAALTGYRVIVIDDRAEFANATRFPDAARIEIAQDLGACLDDRYGPGDHIVIMTRGHTHDRDVLAQALNTDAGYIGMIGSKTKKAAVYDSLLGAGVTRKALDRVHCPIGLPIDAETPEEIAISIMAEIVAESA